MASSYGDQAPASWPLKSSLAGSKRRMNNMAEHILSGSLFLLVVEY